MKPLKLLIISILSFSANAWAQDYYVPVKKELEPLARNPVTEFHLSDSDLIYTLPLEITGVPIKIEMKRDNPGVDGMRLYSGEKATAACMGTNELPACVLTHKNLGIDEQRLDELLKNKHHDPQLLQGAREVAAEFRSGNEPIGFLGKRKK